MKQTSCITSLLVALPFALFFSTYYLLFYLYQPRTVRCPHLIGKNCFTTFKELSTRDLYAKILHIHDDDQLPNGTVVAQIPQPNQEIKEKQTIYLTISQQKQAKPCPDLTHLTKEAIETLVEKQGYEVDFYYLPCSNEFQQRCFAQWPRDHDAVDASIVTVYMGREAQNLVIWPELVGLELTRAQELLTSYGIQATIRGRQQKDKPSYVQAQMPLSGSIIDLCAHDLRVELSIGSQLLRSKS